MRRFIFFRYGGCLCLIGVLAGCGSTDPGSSDAKAGAAATAGSAGSAGVSATGGAATATGGTAAAGGAAVAGDMATGGDTAGAGAPATSADEALMPWKIGNTWTYRVTKNGTVTEKTTTVGAMEVIGGMGPTAADRAYHVTTGKGANDHTESWQGPSGAVPERIVRFREQAFASATGKLQSETYYDPEKLHIDATPEHTVMGASWTEKYSETTLVVGMPLATHNVSERWTVISDNEALQVPAGSFAGVIHFQKVGSSTKDYWYARGVGKLKETGTQTEELSAFTLK